MAVAVFWNWLSTYFYLASCSHLKRVAEFGEQGLVSGGVGFDVVVIDAGIGVAEVHQGVRLYI